MSGEPMITVTQPKISLVLGLLALLGTGWQVASFANDHAYRIEALERSTTEQKELNRELIAEIKHIGSSLTDLLVRLEKMQARQLEAKQP